MDTPELLAGCSLAGLVVAVAIYYVWRQVQTLRSLRRDVQLSPDDRRYLWQQALRRFFNSILMLLFAGLLLGGFLIERQLIAPPAPGAEDAAAVRAGAENSVRLFTGYWILALLVLLAILALAVVDLWATARFGFRHQKQLELDRRAMLKEEAARVRRRRAEMN